jgi:mono/diheme cytochrome c family protein
VNRVVRGKQAFGAPARTLDVACAAMVGLTMLVGIPSAATAQDDPAAAALSAFTTHCARCHQEGQLAGREKPAGGFGFVLDLDSLARNPEYVQAGNPSASQIYTRIVNQSMPKDMDYITILGPTADETKAIAAWIESLSDTAGAAVASRGFIDDEAVLRAMRDDISEVSDFDRPHVRYFTLTHLYNVGDTDEELEVYRQALAKLVNSLSIEPGIVVPEAIDEQKTIFRVDITDLGWDDATWRLVEAANPYFIEYDTPIMEFLQAETYTTVPFVRADWFTFVASQPPVYYDILGLPKTTPELERKLGIDATADRDALRVARAGFQQSGVSRNNRMIERHSLSTGAFWESFDFAANNERKSFFLFPLGPLGSFADFSTIFGFEHDGGEIIFNLPNGLQGYYLTDAKGTRLDTGPTNIVQDPSRRDQAVTNGISCMSCHDKGMQMKEDQVRDYVLGNVAFPKDVRDIIEEIFPPREDMTALMQADRDRFVRALQAAGVDPELKLAGEEITSVLFQRFERDLTMRQAAAEIGMELEEFTERLNMGSAGTYALKQRLEFNLVPRDQFVELFAELVNEITDNRAFDLRDQQVAAYAENYQGTISDPEGAKRFDLALYPNESTFKVGAELTFSVQAELACFLTLINVDQQGRTTILFPNRFNQNNRIEAGRTYQVPSSEIGGFKLIFRDPGKETVIGKCNATSNELHGVEHDFDQSAFTTFGSYDEYVSRALTKRQIIVVEDAGEPAPVPRPRPDAPVTNAYDPHVDIIAEQGVVMQVQP